MAINRSRLTQAVQRLASRAAERAANQLADRTRQNIRASGRVDTGDMLNSVTVEALPASGERVRYRVRITAPYAPYQEEGTAGSQAAPGKFLVFRPRGGSGAVVFAKRTGPITPGHFLRNAARDARVRDYLP